MSERRSAYWMKQLDERILEHLDQEGWATPSMMAQERGFSASEGHIWERCQMLYYIGFIAPMHSDMYELTTDGKLYLEGKIDARHRPRPTVDRVLRGGG
jgi:hypothetical protein